MPQGSLLCLSKPGLLGTPISRIRTHILQLSQTNANANATALCCLYAKNYYLNVFPSLHLSAPGHLFMLGHFPLLLYLGQKQYQLGVLKGTSHNFDKKRSVLQLSQPQLSHCSPHMDGV